MAEHLVHQVVLVRELRVASLHIRQHVLLAEQLLLQVPPCFGVGLLQCLAPAQHVLDHDVHHLLHAACHVLHARAVLHGRYQPLHLTACHVVKVAVRQ